MASGNLTTDILTAEREVAGAVHGAQFAGRSVSPFRLESARLS